MECIAGSRFENAFRLVLGFALFMKKKDILPTQCGKNLGGMHGPAHLPRSCFRAKERVKCDASSKLAEHLNCYC